MIYRSTRSLGQEVTAAQAIVQGLSPDGGLFVPKEFPAPFSAAALKEIFALPYQDMAKKILALFLTDYSAEQLAEIVKGAYGQQWDDDRIAPLTDKKAGNYYLELFHGPTLAFKDVALQCLPRLMKTALENSDDHRGIVILTATSGDTGTAAMRGFQSLAKPEDMQKKLSGFWADYATPEEIEGEIKRVYEESGYVIDPHTAVASLAAKRFKEEDDKPTVVLSTASPYKFPETVYHAISGQNVKEKGLPALKELTDLTGPAPKAMEAFLGHSSREIVIPADNMANEVKRQLDLD
jgi:threonine synthase